VNKVFLNPYLFFIILEGKLIAWDYKNHQQFEFDEKYLSRLLDISNSPISHHQIDTELMENNLILDQEEKVEWGWDCLSKIFHFGTKISEDDLLGINTEDASLFASEYMKLSEDTLLTSPSLFIEKKGETVYLPLPDLSQLADIDLLSVLTKRKTCRTFYDESVSLETLSSLLYVTFGNFYSERKEYDNLGLERIGLRKTSPAGGGLHASEAYLVAFNVDGLPQGIYHYQAHAHILTLINSETSFGEFKKIFCGQYYMENLSFGVFVTSRLEKLWHKYPHSRAYRVALLDIGHLSQTFQLVATALNLSPWLSGAFIDDEVSKMLMLDEISEQPLFFVGAGYGPGLSLDPMTAEYALKSKGDE